MGGTLQPVLNRNERIRKNSYGWYHGSFDAFRPMSGSGRDGGLLYLWKDDVWMLKRTIYCGAVREDAIGRTETVSGWVQTKRDMGGVVFIDLRDREGVLQVVFDARELPPEQFTAADRLKNETVIAVRGYVRQRDEETYNPRLDTGSIELRASALSILSQAQPLQA